MTCANLSTVLAPNILYSKTPDPLNMVQEMEQANVVFTLIIQSYAVIFPDDDLQQDVITEEAPEETAADSGENEHGKKLVRKKSRRLKSEVEKIRAPSVSVSLSTSSSPAIPKKKRKKAGTISRSP